MSAQDPFKLDTHAGLLLSHAVRSVRFAADRGEALTVTLSEFPSPLHKSGACFVTLKKNAALRGCIGSLEAKDPLVINIANNAHGAVARDTRFPTVSMRELDDLSVSLSVLSPLTKIVFSDDQDLLHQITPGEHGLVISDHGRRSTFLPQVWHDLPDPVEFLKALKIKGGFAQDQPAGKMQAWRYQVHDIGPQDLGSAS